MKELFLDIETYSSANLKKCGVYKYVESPDFEILLFGYSVDGGSVTTVDLARGETIPAEILSALTDDRVTKWAHNAQFERICLSRYLGYPTGEYLDPSSWKCSMVWSAYLGLPLSLDSVGAVLGLKKQKLREGKDLIRYFSMPCKPTKANGGRTRNLPEHNPEKWERYKEYNIRDVETEMQIIQKLSRFPVPDDIWEEYHLSEEINDRGIKVDMQFVRQAIRIDALSRKKLTAALKELTGLENPNSVVQMKEWLSDHGIETETLGKKTAADLIKQTDGVVSEVLTLRLKLAKSSVKKYQAMQNAACEDDRCRGMFMFYGANRTGRFSGRIVQLQNLPQNHMTDLTEARNLVRDGNIDALDLLYDDIPDTLSQLIRTAFIPAEGKKFYVADFSAIEARVLAWFAGEDWRTEVFSQGGDIYCQSASEMFGVPVEKHGVNGHLRQKGKIAELACIAEDSLVLTDHGLIPIQHVSTEDRVWDGENWVSHDGVVHRGEREVITYEGLTATEDHLVWTCGESEPVQFGIAAARCAHLIQTGNGGRAIRLGENYMLGETMEQEMESLLCFNQMPRMFFDSMAGFRKLKKRKIKRLSALFTASSSDPGMVGQTTDSSKATMHKSKRSRISQLWCQRHKIWLFKCNRGWSLSDRKVRIAGSGTGDRSYRHERRLCTRKSSICGAQGQLHQSKKKRSQQIRAAILALLKSCCHSETIIRHNKGADYSGCTESCSGETKELAFNRGKARLYDIRNAGRYHRFTVSGKLVHNCGYGGAVGALKAMGALEMGLSEEELQPLVNVWRQSNPHIVRFWWDVDHSVKKVIRERQPQTVRNLKFYYMSGMLFIRLPSGRTLSYVRPRIGVNRFGGESVTYEGISATKKWERIESYGPKFVENCCQGTSRDILMYALKTLRHYRIVAHVHDEIIIEADPDTSLDILCEQMGRTPPWAEGLLLNADGYVCDYYMKD